MLAQGEDALYVSFLGTKAPGDLMASLDLKRVAFLPDAPGAAAHRCAGGGGVAEIFPPRFCPGGTIWVGRGRSGWIFDVGVGPPLG